jgi:hypothetical protein
MVYVSLFTALSPSWAIAQDRLLACRGAGASPYELQLQVKDERVVAIDYRSASQDGVAECRVMANANSSMDGFYSRWSATNDGQEVEIQMSDGSRLVDYAKVFIIKANGAYRLKLSVAEGQSVCGQGVSIPSQVTLVVGSEDCSQVRKK